MNASELWFSISHATKVPSAFYIGEGSISKPFLLSKVSLL
jgi:hypothetical protein